MTGLLVIVEDVPFWEVEEETENVDLLVVELPVEVELCFVVDEIEPDDVVAEELETEELELVDVFVPLVGVDTTELELLESVPVVTELDEVVRDVDWVEVVTGTLLEEVVDKPAPDELVVDCTTLLVVTAALEVVWTVVEETTADVVVVGTGRLRS